ncbi:MAG: general secretion pathway protein GspB [Candidatus Omnitrophota bacterium]
MPFSFCLSQAPEQFIYDARGKRDPFIPLVTPDGRLLNLDSQQEKEALRIEGIIYDDKGISYAIINGMVVRIGDIVDGNQILKIEDDKVIFIKEGNPFSLELKQEEK